MEKLADIPQFWEKSEYINLLTKNDFKDFRGLNGFYARPNETEGEDGYIIASDVADKTVEQIEDDLVKQGYVFNEGDIIIDKKGLASLNAAQELENPYYPYKSANSNTKDVK